MTEATGNISIPSTHEGIRAGLLPVPVDFSPFFAFACMKNLLGFPCTTQWDSLLFMESIDPRVMMKIELSKKWECFRWRCAERGPLWIFDTRLISRTVKHWKKL